MLVLASINDSFNDKLIYKLLSRKLSPAINVALISAEDRPITELLSIADQIWEVDQSNISPFQNSNKKPNYMINHFLTRVIEIVYAELAK